MVRITIHGEFLTSAPNKGLIMKKTLTIALSTLLLSTPAHTDDKYSHFPSLEAPNTSVALCNLVKFNKKLQAIANKPKLSTEDMVKVHELTYTLENAVMRLQKDLDVIATDLEKVHKASEVLDSKTVKGSGNLYLGATRLITDGSNCK